MSTALLDRLSRHEVMSTVPKKEIAWVAEHGKLRHLDTGDVLTSKNGPVEGVHVVLDGHLSIHVDRGAGRRKIMKWRGGDVTGLMPYSLLISPREMSPPKSRPMWSRTPFHPIRVDRLNITLDWRLRPPATQYVRD